MADLLKDVRPKETADLSRVEILRDGRSILIDATTPDGLGMKMKRNDIVTVPVLK